MRRTERLSCQGLALLLLFAASSAWAASGAQDWLERKRPPIEELEQAVAGDPRDFDSLMGLGIAQLEDGESEKAVETIRAALAAAPASAPAHLFLAWAYNEQIIGSPIRPRGAQDPSGTPQMRQPMTEDRRRNLMVLANGEFETALRLDPTDAFAWALWGKALLQRSQNNPLLWPTHDPEPILAKFRTALEVEPGHRGASAGLARLLYVYGGVYQHHVKHPDGPVAPPWAPDDLAATAREYMAEATELYWSFVRKPPEKGIGSLAVKVLQLLLMQDRYDDALALCREPAGRGKYRYLGGYLKREWKRMLRGFEEGAEDSDRYRLANAAYRNCVAWLDG